VKVRPQTIFSFLVLVFFVLVLWGGKDWPVKAQLYPWVVGVPMVLLAAFNLFMDLKGGNQKSALETTPADFQFTKGIDPVLARWRTVNIFAWILGFVLGIWLVGFFVTVPLFFFLYLKVQSREGWTLSLVLTGAAWFMSWGLFDQLLHLPLPEGQIFFWLGL
jgi:hypothetical protein